MLFFSSKIIWKRQPRLWFRLNFNMVKSTNIKPYLKAFLSFSQECFSWFCANFFGLLWNLTGNRYNRQIQIMLYSVVYNNAVLELGLYQKLQVWIRCFYWFHQLCGSLSINHHFMSVCVWYIALLVAALQTWNFNLLSRVIGCFL